MSTGSVFEYRPRSPKMVNSALCSLYVELRRDGGDGLEHVEALLRLRRIAPESIRVPIKRKRIFRRGELWRAVLDCETGRCRVARSRRG